MATNRMKFWANRWQPGDLKNIKETVINSLDTNGPSVKFLTTVNPRLEVELVLFEN